MYQKARKMVKMMTADDNDPIPVCVDMIFGHRKQLVYSRLTDWS